VRGCEAEDCIRSNVHSCSTTVAHGYNSHFACFSDRRMFRLVYVDTRAVPARGVPTALRPRRDRRGCIEWVLSGHMRHRKVTLTGTRGRCLGPSPGWDRAIASAAGGGPQTKSSLGRRPPAPPRCAPFAPSTLPAEQPIRTAIVTRVQSVAHGIATECVTPRKMAKMHIHTHTWYVGFSV
jgi:hypothetical protein